MTCTELGVLASAARTAEQRSWRTRLTTHTHTHTRTHCCSSSCKNKADTANLTDDTRQVNGQSLQLHPAPAWPCREPANPSATSKPQQRQPHSQVSGGRQDQGFQQHGEGFLYNLPGFGKVSSSLLSSAIEAVSSDPGCIARSAVCVCITSSVPPRASNSGTHPVSSSTRYSALGMHSF